MIARCLTVSTNRLDEITQRWAQLPPGPYRWRGNSDFPESIHLASTSYTTPDGTTQFGLSLLGLVRDEVTREQAARRGVGDYDSIDVLTERDEHGHRIGVRIGDRVVLNEPEDTYDQRYDAAMQSARNDLIDEWLDDGSGSTRHEYRLAFCGLPDGMRMQTAQARAVWEVAPHAVTRDDRAVYRADIAGLRNAVAQAMEHMKSDVDYLLAEVITLRAELAAAKNDKLT